MQILQCNCGKKSYGGEIMVFDVTKARIGGIKKDYQEIIDGLHD